MVDSVQVKIDDVILYRSINVLKLRLDRLVEYSMGTGRTMEAPFGWREKERKQSINSKRRRRTWLRFRVSKVRSIIDFKILIKNLIIYSIFIVIEI